MPPNLWAWLTEHGPVITVLGVVVWRLDGHLCAFRADLARVHDRLLTMVNESLAGK